MTTNYKRLTVDDVTAVLERTKLKPHVVGVAIHDPTLAIVTLYPILHHGKSIGNEAGSALRALKNVGADMVEFSAADRHCSFRIREVSHA